MSVLLWPVTQYLHIKWVLTHAQARNYYTFTHNHLKWAQFGEAAILPSD